MKDCLLVVKIERSKREIFHLAAKMKKRRGSEIIMQAVNRAIKEYEEKN